MYPCCRNQKRNQDLKICIRVVGRKQDLRIYFRVATTIAQAMEALDQGPEPAGHWAAPGPAFISQCFLVHKVWFYDSGYKIDTAIWNIG